MSKYIEQISTGVFVHMFVYANAGHVIAYLGMRLVIHFKKSENWIKSVNMVLLSGRAANFSIGCAPREFHT
jgi:hypothetical protein